MNINNLILIIKKKIKKDILVDEIKIEDKTFLHKKHKGFIKNKYHLKLYSRIFPFI